MLPPGDLLFPPQHTSANSLKRYAMKRGICSCLRSRVIEFLIQSAQLLEVLPIVKYSALSLFADRFYPALSRHVEIALACRTIMFLLINKILTSIKLFPPAAHETGWRLEDGRGTHNWLLHPIGESNLQLFALVSLWVSSKIHDTPPLSVKNLKSLGNKFIKEQHYTNGDLLEAEMVLMQVLEFRIGTTDIAFVFVEELLLQLTVVARVGEHVKFEACMDVMDLLYENEETSVLCSSSRALAASILVVAYVVTVPPQTWEFPILPWVNFVTSCKEEDILDSVCVILKHIFEPKADY